MKISFRICSLNFLLAMLVIATCGSFALSQEDTVSQPTVTQPTNVVESIVDAPAFAGIDDDATISTKVFREQLAKSISEQAEKSGSLSRGEKRRIQRVMRGGWFNESRKNMVLDRVAAKMLADGAIVITPEGVQAAVDWDSILAFIEKLIPLIIQLISLFGG